MATTDISSLLNQLVTDTQGTSVPTSLLQNSDFNLQKTSLKEQMQGLTNNETGVSILKQLVNSNSVSVIERSAAAELLNPGTDISLDPQGNFVINAPSSNVQYNPQLPQTAPIGQQEAQKVEQQQNIVKKGVTVPELLTGINDGFAAIQNETDPVKIASGMANISQSISDFQAARTAELREQSRNLFGIAQLESQVQTDKQLDMQESQQYHGVEYLGPSEASQATMTQLALNTGKANQWLEQQLSTDPTLAAVKTKASYLQSYADSKFKNAAELQSTSGIESLVDSNSIDAVLVATGNDPQAATPEQRRQVSLQIQSGNQYYTQAMQLGLSPNQIPVFLTAGGGQANMARNVLVNKLNGDTAAADEMINVYNNFETASGLSPEQLKQQGFVEDMNKTIIDPMANTKEGRAKSAALRAQLKWNYITQTLNKRATDQMLTQENFASPQADSLIEWNSINTALAGAKKSTGDNTPITLKDTISRLTWPEDKMSAQIKEDDLVNYLYSQAQEKGNSVIGLPNQFANKNLIRSYIQTVRVDTAINKNILTKQQQADYIGRVGGAAIALGGLAGNAVGWPAVIYADQQRKQTQGSQ